MDGDGFEWWKMGNGFGDVGRISTALLCFPAYSSFVSESIGLSFLLIYIHVQNNVSVPA